MTRLATGVYSYSRAELAFTYFFETRSKDILQFVGVIATYNMVSRFLVALGIDEE